mgnify:FL=1
MRRASRVLFLCSLVGCGGAGRLSSYTAVNAACMQQEQHIVERQGTNAAQDAEALQQVRDACDHLLAVIEGSN